MAVWSGAFLLYYLFRFAPDWGDSGQLIPYPNGINLAVVARRIGQFGLISALSVLIAGIGALGLRFRSFRANRAEDLALAFGLGAGIVGTVLLPLGLAHLWLKPLIGALIAGPGLYGIYSRWRGYRAAQAAPDGAAHSSTPRLPLALGVFFALLGLYGAFMPEVFFDGLVYHLALPHAYWLNHGYLATPYVGHSGFPQFQEMLFGVGDWLAGPQGAHLIHWAEAIAAAGVCFAWADDIAGRRAGLWAAALFLATPQVVLNSWRGAVENGWALFLAIAVFGLYKALADPERSLAWSVVGGLACGFAMGCKYVAWPEMGVLFLVFAYFSLKATESQRACRDMFAFAGIALGVTLPWIVKNVLLYGNPIFPFLQERFASTPVVNWRGLVEMNARDAKTTLGSLAGFWSFLIHPWTMTFDNADSGCFGPAFLWGLPLLALVKPVKRELRFLSAAFLGLWLLWAFTSITSRFFVPVLPLFCVLLAVAIEQPWDAMAKLAIGISLAVVMVSNAIWGFYWLHRYGADDVIWGAQSEADYLGQLHLSYAQPYYAAASFINQLPPDSRVFMLGEARTYYLDRNTFATTTEFVPNPMGDWVERSANADELYSTLRRNGVTHLLVNVPEYMRFRHVLRLTPHGRDVLIEFWGRYLHKVFDKMQPEILAWTSVYEMKPPTVEPRSKVVDDVVLKKMLEAEFAP